MTLHFLFLSFFSFFFLLSSVSHSLVVFTCVFPIFDIYVLFFPCVLFYVINRITKQISDEEIKKRCVMAAASLLCATEETCATGGFSTEVFENGLFFFPSFKRLSGALTQ
jgi:hypothetical protein